MFCQLFDACKKFAMGDDDPYSVFSDDDDDDESGREHVPAKHIPAFANGSSTSQIAKSLMEKANARLLGNNTKNPSHNNVAVKDEQSEPLEAVDLSHLPHLDFDWPPPAYLGPVILVSALPVGGGRGFVASRTLEPGTLILVEEPAMRWPPEQLGRKLDLVSVKHLLERPTAKTLVHDMEYLHPSKENVDHHAKDTEHLEQIQKMMLSLESEAKRGEVEKLVELAKDKGITSRDGSNLVPNDILRLLLALRYNGLESGVYRHAAMLNHDCTPNCAKLLPGEDQQYSEVRTTRRVCPGESLTISYVPRVMSHASRRLYLWEQHRFDIGAQLKKGSPLKMELIGSNLPPSHIYKCREDNIAYRIENATAELEKMLDGIQNDIDTGGAAEDTWETLKAMEQTSLELYNESVEQLKNDGHVLLIPILLIHTETCDLLHKATSLATSIQLGILRRQVLSFRRLIPLQISSLGPDHFDLARTNLDLANAISELLSRSPKSLYELNISCLKTFEQWSSLAHSSRQEHKRIRSLYPHDAEAFIISSTSA